MGRKCVILLTVLLLSTCASSVGHTARTKWRAGTDTFKAACYWVNTLGYEVDCKKIEPPTPVISLVVNARATNLLGFYYHSDKYVFIRRGMTPEKTQEVIFHETVHYILYEKYGKSMVRCESEWAARIATDLYTSRPYDDWWVKAYKC